MFKLISIILIVASVFAKEIPMSLAKGISEETAVLTRIPPKQWQEVGYRGITKKLTDAVVDDSGNVHLIVDEYYRGAKHIWYYFRYDKNGKNLFKKEIHQANYLTVSHNLLVSRILINPDMTALVFYPDSAFYTCWVKIDKEGSIIERNEPRWWRGDAQFRVCSAGQDSFHIVTWPVSFWTEITIRHHPEFGAMPLVVQPARTPTLYYSNNFLLKGECVLVRSPYMHLEVPKIVSLPGKRIFCFYNNQDYGWSWIMDSEGKCYDGERFEKKDLDRICFSKVIVDTILSQLGIEMRRGDGLSFTCDSTIGVGVFSGHAIYLVKYNLDGEIIQKGQGLGKLMKINDMDKVCVSPFITQIFGYPIYNQTGSFDKTIYYWGFDDLGNFFLQIY